MRAFTHITALRTQLGDRTVDTLIALDEDGYLWRAQLLVEEEGVMEADWAPIRGPGDAPPFMDTRSYLDRLEARIREQTAERDRLREHFDSLPQAADPNAPPEYDKMGTEEIEQHIGIDTSVFGGSNEAEKPEV